MLLSLRCRSIRSPSSEQVGVRSSPRSAALSLSGVDMAKVPVAIRRVMASPNPSCANWLDTVGVDGNSQVRSRLQINRSLG